MVSLIVAAVVQAQVQLLYIATRYHKIITCSKMQMALWLRYSSIHGYEGLDA